MHTVTAGAARTTHALGTDDTVARTGVMSSAAVRWGIAALAVLVTVWLRLALLPAEPWRTYSFGHDSAYLAQVATNLLAGRGFVNDGLWLVFLNPDALPIPFHNAKPLYPLLAAGVAMITGVAAGKAGYLLSAFAGGLLAIAVTILARSYTRRFRTALLIGLAVSVFPTLWLDSLTYLTDALFTAFFFLFVAALMRAGRGAAIAAGVLLSLTWLTRSQVVIAVPAILVFVALRFGREGLIRFAALTLPAALVVASPWLIQTYRVWGSPLRSDDGYYIVQSIAAEKFAGPRPHRRVWHSPTPPPSLMQFATSDPMGLARREVIGSVHVVRETLGRWALNRPVPALCLLATILFLVNARWRKWARSPEVAAVAVYGVCLVLVLALRHETFEVRYMNTLAVPFAALSIAGTAAAWSEFRRARRASALAIAIGGVLLWALIIPFAAFRTTATYALPQPSFAAYAAAATDVNARFTQGGAVVVGHTPYTYSFITKAPALAIPESDDDFLLQYMAKYGARYVFLTADELEYWRPRWKQAGPPPSLRLVSSASGFVYERTE